MSVIPYRIVMYSEWHCSSGLSEGSGNDVLVIRDINKLPFIPGKTLKGLVRDSAETFAELGHIDDDFLARVFGLESDRQGECHFSNAELDKDAQAFILENNAQDCLYRSKASTAIDRNGIACKHSLRRMETVVPLTLSATISGVRDTDYDDLTKCIRFVKRLGLGRNRGLGRCDVDVMGGGAI